MRRLVIIFLTLLLVLTLSSSKIKAVEEEAEKLPSPEIEYQVVMGNFRTQGTTYPTVVNLLYGNKYQKVEIKAIFDPNKIKPEEYFKKGLAEIFRKWKLDIRTFKFDPLKFTPEEPTGAYKGYMVLVKTK